MKSLQKLAKADKRRYYALYLIALALGSVIILQAYMIVSIVDDIFLQNESFQHVMPMLLLLLGVLILRVLLSYGNGKIGVQMAANIKADYRRSLVKSFSRESLMSSYQGQSGKKISVLLEAVDELDSFFSKYIPQRIVTTVVPLLILIVVFSQHVYSGLILLVTAPFIPLFMAIIGMQTQKKSEEQLESLAAFSGRFLDTLQGLVTLKLFGRSKHYKKVIEKSSLGFRDSTMKILKIAFTSSLMLEFISMLSIGLVALELGLRLVVFQNISFFTAFFILLLVPEFYTSLKELGSAFHAGKSSTGAAEKVEQQLENKEKKLEWGSVPLTSTSISIEMENVHYQYPSKRFSLENVNLVVPSRAQIAIVGRSGSGKTTLLHILAGLLNPKSGEVRINGKVLTQYVERDWFKKISYITQHPFLFSGTISENISLGVDASLSEIKEAATLAGVNELIESLNDGYETIIGEGGRGLSGGEKQRIALARAFLKKPSVVLFDEPTTGLDLVTEKLLHQSMQQLSQHSTVITVAHRLQTIKQSNQILFLDQGKQVAQGTHEQLLASVPSYRELFAMSEEGDRDE
ncbi:thiol reductant ABC exporter subunit CydD [Halalkalibacter krulwichiae]|uniref:ATP-binding/permease protein CydD n=1 Tax=Halalkalibacter krulwichiae TaxID=199441 RepID=A0A1X9M654_9BACI|nr:thiol reductant ABC exporter subunit CydD [Halalkalibacter krulwichiae]ARK28926.1 ATP-binding/permease protein CydD [Halalkalibacter krulwichiae]